MQVLQGLVSRYEAHHKVSYTREAIEAAVTLSERHIPDRRLPDKALDLLDEAGSQARITADQARSGDTDIHAHHQQIELSQARPTSSFYVVHCYCLFVPRCCLRCPITPLGELW